MHDRTTQEQDPDPYLHTVERLEPDIHPIDTAAGWASIGISLRRIADTMEELLILLQARQQEQATLGRPWP